MHDGGKTRGVTATEGWGEGIGGTKSWWPQKEQRKEI